ncbi:MAG: hypothetical protein ACLGHY_07555, partial [Gammaproteobacteria bacterium]
MSRNGFILMLIVTVIAIALGDAIAGHYTEPGLLRILLVGAIAGAIVFPVARLAERFGLIKGSFAFSKAGAPRDR